MKAVFVKLTSICLILALGIGTLASCGTPSTDKKSSSAASAGSVLSEKESSESITVTDVKGEVEIHAAPKRVVDISGSSDLLHILGYSVVGTANSDAYDYTKLPSYLEDVLSDAKIVGFSYQDTMDIENIISLNPDLIIISTRQEKMYDQLKELAPTVMIELAQITWEDDLKTLANLFNKTAEADAWLADYQAKAKKIGEEIRKANGEDLSYLSILASGGQIFVFDAAGMGSLLYQDLGLAKPAGMPEQEDVSLPVVTYEGLAAIEADKIIVIGTEADMAELEQNAIWQSLPAVAAGNVVALPTSPYFTNQ